MSNWYCNVHEAAGECEQNNCDPTIDTEHCFYTKDACEFHGLKHCRHIYRCGEDGSCQKQWHAGYKKPFWHTEEECKAAGVCTPPAPPAPDPDDDCGCSKVQDPGCPKGCCDPDLGEFCHNDQGIEVPCTWSDDKCCIDNLGRKVCACPCGTQDDNGDDSNWGCRIIGGSKVCVPNYTGTGTIYSSSSDCAFNCNDNYTCTINGCEVDNSGTGEYLSLGDCQKFCGTTTERYATLGRAQYRENYTSKGPWCTFANSGGTFCYDAKKDMCLPFIAGVVDDDCI